ncbi:uncharacterized protein [Nicotiana sylvestris]|uniref:uncharacterized protein n=1 Tax=Nicotiana sylvestris TaxID=4096 RepID=UPI00388C8017
MATTLNKTLPELSKLEPLDGNNYKRWSEKLLIFFEQLEVDYVLFNEPPADVVSNTTDVANSSNITATVIADDDAKKKFEKDNKTVRGHLLNHMPNTLFDLFINYKSVKVIWDSLEKKYDTDDGGKEVHEYENLTADVLNKGTEMCEILQPNVLLEKFSASWSDYRNQLKHKKKNLTLQKLISHMRTEEANRLKDEEAERLKDKIKSLSFNSSKANHVKSASTFEKDEFKGASRHLCANKELFYDFEKSTDGECVYMGNSTTAGVMGKGKVLLKLTSGKILALNNVMYVPSIRRNLDSSALLNKVGLKLVFESNKIVISCGGDFVGKGYLNGGLFVLNII